MDSELAGTTRWIVIPTGRHRDHYELPLWMFSVVTDVLQDVNYYPLGLEAVREGILLRLSERQDYEAESDFISLQFLADLRSSLNHPDDRRRPWPYNRPDDESEEETSSGESDEQSSSHDAQMGPIIQRPYQNQTTPEMHEQQENPDEVMHDWASDVSMTSFHSARDITAPNEPGTASSSSSSDAIGIPDDVASSDSETEDRHFKFLQATFQFSQLQLEQLQLLSMSRQHQNAARKARKESRRTAQMDERMPDATKTPMDQPTQRNTRKL